MYLYHNKGFRSASGQIVDAGRLGQFQRQPSMDPVSVDLEPSNQLLPYAECIGGQHVQASCMARQVA